MALPEDAPQPTLKGCSASGYIAGVGIITNFIPFWFLCNSTRMTPKNPVLII